MRARRGLCLAVATLCSREVIAFPSNLHAGLHHHVEKRLLLSPLTNIIDTTGDHQFIPPTETDQRGPCPGLNALANHGYIDRTGIVSLTEVITAANQVYGMSVELITFLAVMGVVWTGDPISLDPSFSIGGKDARVQNLLGNLMGTLNEPEGLDNSHNWIETDASPTRNDLFVTGDPVTMNVTLFEEMYAALVDVPDQDTAMAMLAQKRFNDSVQTNPNFYWGPFSGTISGNAGYFFALRLLSNHTHEHPDGIITAETLKSFWSVTGEPGNFQYKKGWERIPDGFVKTPVDWGIVQFNLILLDWITKWPGFASIGGNTGTVNSFAGFDLGDPVTGLKNVPNFLEGNNLMCFALQLVKTAAPNYTSTIWATLGQPLNLLMKTLDASLLSLACPGWDLLTKDGTPLWEKLQEKYPGARNGAL